MQLITTLIILLIALLIAHFFILHTGTQIGEKGHKNALSQNIIGIFEAVIVLILGIFWALNSYGSYRLYSLGGILLAGILLISSIIGLKGVLAETREDLSTERLTNIEVIPDGYRNHSRRIEGIANGKRSWFLLRGVDKIIARNIEQKHPSHILITFHPSNRRIESILIED